MFDPTIYSLQPLQIGNNVSESGKPKSPLEIDNMQTIDSGVGAELLASEKFGGIDELQNQHIDGNDEHTTGTLSRKTSTTSDVYSSMSDYTPENTITSSTTSSPPTISMLQNVLPLDESSDANQTNQASVIQNEGTAAGIENIATQGTTAAEYPNTESAAADSLNRQMAQVDSLIKDVEAAIISDKVIKPQPIRKISRFLVSPAILSTDPVVPPKLQPILGESSEPQPAKFTPSDLSLTLDAVNEAETLSSIPQPNHPVVQSPTAILTIDQQVQYIGSSLANQPSAIYVVDSSSGEGLSVDPNNTLQQANSATTPQNSKPLGPEHINTLEQLKIGLENITHAHVTTKPKETSAQELPMNSANMPQYVQGPGGQIQQLDMTGTAAGVLQTSMMQQNSAQTNFIYSTRRASDDATGSDAHISSFSDQCQQQQQMMYQLSQQQHDSVQSQQQIHPQNVSAMNLVPVQSSAPTTLLSMPSSITEGLNLDVNARKLSQQGSLETSNEM